MGPRVFVMAFLTFLAIPVTLAGWIAHQKAAALKAALDVVRPDALMCVARFDYGDVTLTDAKSEGGSGWWVVSFRGVGDQRDTLATIPPGRAFGAGDGSVYINVDKHTCYSLAFYVHE